MVPGVWSWIGFSSERHSKICLFRNFFHIVLQKGKHLCFLSPPLRPHMNIHQPKMRKNGLILTELNCLITGISNIPWFHLLMTVTWWNVILFCSELPEWLLWSTLQMLIMEKMIMWHLLSMFSLFLNIKWQIHQEISMKGNEYSVICRCR